MDRLFRCSILYIHYENEIMENTISVMILKGSDSAFQDQLPLWQLMSCHKIWEGLTQLWCLVVQVEGNHQGKKKGIQREVLELFWSPVQEKCVFYFGVVERCFSYLHLLLCLSKKSKGSPTYNKPVSLLQRNRELPRNLCVRTWSDGPIIVGDFMWGHWIIWVNCGS